MMRPFAFLDRMSDRLLAVVLTIAIVCTGALSLWLKSYDDELKKVGHGDGIVALELVGTVDRASAIIDTWRQNPDVSSGLCPHDRLDCARDSLNADFLFILVYTATIALAMLCTFRCLKIKIRSVRWLFVLPAATALLDMSENIALLSLLPPDGSVMATTVFFATLCASLKFFLIAVSLLAIASALGLWLMTCPWRTKDRQPAKMFIKPIAMVLRNERRYLRGRRKLAGLDTPDVTDPSPIGLSLSGGGIRSAMLGLGLLQTLTESEFGRHVDYLSTVSGGGYIGTALSSLLSMHELHHGPAPTDGQQFVFRPGVPPQFVLGSPRAPFYQPPRSHPASPRPWLDGGMVVAHLRAFGDFLARRRRLLDRDMLRAMGSIGVGITASLFLYVVLLLVLSGIVLTLIYFNHSYGFGFGCLACGFNDYWLALWAAIGPWHFVWTALFGGLLLMSTTVCASLIEAASPSGWFVRDGDIPQDTRQYRLLWVVGILALACGLLLGRPLARSLGVDPNPLFPVAFFLGTTLTAGLFHALLAVAVGHRERGFFSTNIQRRSFVAASLTLSGYLLLFSIGLALLPWVLESILSDGGGINLANTTTASVTGGVTMGVLAWLNARRKAVKEVGAQVGQLVGWLKGMSDTLRRLMLGLAVTVFVIASLILGIWLFDQVLDAFGLPARWELAALATVVVGLMFVLLGFVFDFNKLSLHHFYRDRLVEAFLRTDARPAGAYGRPLEVKRDHGEIKLTELHGLAKGQPPLAGWESFFQYERDDSAPRPVFRCGLAKPPRFHRRRFPGAATSAPYHLYVTSVNLATERDMNFRSRKSDVFVFSKLYCGSSVTGYVDTAVYRSGDTRVARVMTTSGAALDSAVGRETFFAQSFAATLLNIRLGQWLENPAFRAGSRVHLQEHCVLWPIYMAMEALGMSDSHHRLLHLSDGGHSGDNLGLIPLLQRRCRLILVMDAEYDPDYSFSSLAHALRYADVDLGIGVDLPLDSLTPNEAGYTDAHFAIGRIHYPATDHCTWEEDGWLIVLKSSVTKTDGVSIQKFKEAHPAFPQESTADQFFSEDQVEAYRQLGQAMAKSLLTVHPELARGELAV
jgi:uncharacterized membrane protein